MHNSIRREVRSLMVTAVNGRPKGPPRKPAALAMLHGDHKKNPARVNQREPRVAGIAVKPDGMSESAAAIWDDVAPGLSEVGVLTVPDVPLFVEFCEALVLARLFRVRADQEPAAVGAWSKAMTVVMALGGRFGMTPSDRTRLVLVGDPAASVKDPRRLLSG